MATSSYSPVGLTPCMRIFTVPTNRGEAAPVTKCSDLKVTQEARPRRLTARRAGRSSRCIESPLANFSRSHGGADLSCQPLVVQSRAMADLRLPAETKYRNELDALAAGDDRPRPP